VDVWVIGRDRTCLPGFHVANIAAALAATNVRVRVFELSGVLPNAAFYFCLPPAVYIERSTPEARTLTPGLNKISVAFDTDRLAGSGNPRERVSVNLIHMPPQDTPALEKCANELSRTGVDRWALSLGGRSDGLGLWVDSKAVFELALEPSAPGAYARGYVGEVVGWEASVADRVPSVVRNPRSGLARAYLGVVESLLSRIHSVRQRSQRGRSVRIVPSRQAR
jgi:hypothetical protein